MPLPLLAAASEPLEILRQVAAHLVFESIVVDVQKEKPGRRQRDKPSTTAPEKTKYRSNLNCLHPTSRQPTLLPLKETWLIWLMRSG